MSVDKTEKVEVLYDYTYSDEQGVVEIKKGQRYKLVEKTNNEWWHVCDLDENASADDEEGFFVPAQYVCVVKSSPEDEAKSALSSLDIALDEEEDKMTVRPAQPEKGNVPPLQQRSKEQNGIQKSADDETDYVNLEDYRAQAKISTGNSHGVTDMESDYANLPFQQRLNIPAQEDGPSIEDGKYVRVLVEGLPWDIYEDQSKRKFFHNRETGEVTWKPPRKEKPTSPVLPRKTEEDNSEYTKQEEAGDVFFINKSTKEKWQQLKDMTGRQYFHRLGSNDTMWELPACSDASQVKSTVDRDEVGSLGVNRQSKSRSMYGKIENTAKGTFDPKASTLPHNFSPNTQLEKSSSMPTFQQVQTSQQFEEQHMQGFLNKAKISDTGKRKVKKTWVPTYVMLHGSNLVFYKDQKATAQKPGSPHGKPELVISLIGAKVDFNPPKDFTSRRNTIMLSLTAGSQFLLNTDDDKVIHEWLVALKIASNDLSEQQEREFRETTLNKKGTSRTMSDSGSIQGGDDRGKPNMLGIRAKLLNLLVRRPTQDELVKQGIIKDAVFGSSLQDLCARDKFVVPNFVVECITAVEKRGLSHDGLYRISGNLAEIQRLRCLIDKADEGYSLVEDEQWDVHTLTGALKLFFRELREPLFTFNYVQKFTEAIKKESRKDKLKYIHDAISSIPKCHQETMRVLFQHLRNVVQFSNENRMQTQNVAIVFGPTLMWLGEEDFNKMAVFTVYQSKVVEFILLEYDNLFRHK